MTLWLRLYVGFTEDAKFRMAARNAGVTVRDVTAVMVSLFEDAAADDHRGIATRGLAHHAFVLELDEPILMRIVSALADLKVVSQDEFAVVINNWDKRQYLRDTDDPTNAIRQKRFREKHKKGAPKVAVTADSVIGNASNGYGNGAVRYAARPEQNRSESYARQRAKALEGKETKVEEAKVAQLETLEARRAMEGKR